jgi:AraC-like DNA-binding protein
MTSRSDAYLILFTEAFFYENKTALELLQNLRIFDFTIHSPKLVIDKDTSQEFIVLASKMEKEYRKPKDFAKQDVLRNLLRLFLLYAERLKVKELSYQERVANYPEFIKFKHLLEDHYRTYHKVIDYARLLSISPKKLNFLTKQIAHRTAKAFVDERIILETKRLLSYTNLSVKEIAYALGFDEPTNFVKYFKRHTRHTPAQFRNNVFQGFSLTS